MTRHVLVTVGLWVAIYVAGAFVAWDIDWVRPEEWTGGNRALFLWVTGATTISVNWSIWLTRQS